VSGAVLGVVVVTLVTEGLRIFEGGLHIGSKVVSLPHGTQEIGLGVFMAVILVCRPNGLVGRSEIDWRCVWPRRRGGQEFASKPSALVPHQ
jgi:branched-chain amino acid transport system permease protein